MNLRRIAVVGAGAMGRGIAQILAGAGLEVLLHDQDPGTLREALDTIARRLRQQVEDGELSALACRRALAGLTGAADLSDAASAQLAIESVPEHLDLKKQVLGKLDRHCAPGTILASNTSGLDVDELAAATGRPDRVVGMHFFNPPPRMPLIELVCSEHTSDATLATVRDLAVHLGKTPIVAPNRPGFLVNRILFPMINEAIAVLEEGVATAEEIDRAMQLGASHPIGPLALADFIGLDVTLDVLDSLEQRLDSRHRACALLREKVARGELGRKSGSGFHEYPA